MERTAARSPGLLLSFGAHQLHEIPVAAGTKHHPPVAATNLGIPWLVDASFQSLPPSSHDLAYVRVFKWHLYKVVGVGLGSTLIQHDFILT